MITQTYNMNKLTEFIKNNNLVFKDGYRNHPLTILCGYALSIDLGIEDILKVIPEDSHEEAERVFDYAEDNNYGDWWEDQTEYVC